MQLIKIRQFISYTQNLYVPNYNNNYTVNINTKSDLICEDLIQSNLKLIHSHIVSNHLSQRPPNKVLQDQTPSVSPAELLLSRETRRTLAQLRTNKSPLLVSYLFSIGDPRHPSPLCPLCLMHDHTSSHLFLFFFFFFCCFCSRFYIYIFVVSVCEIKLFFSPRLSTLASEVPIESS